MRLRELQSHLLTINSTVTPEFLDSCYEAVWEKSKQNNPIFLVLEFPVEIVESVLCMSHRLNYRVFDGFKYWNYDPYGHFILGGYEFRFRRLIPTWMNGFEIDPMPPKTS